MISEEILNFLKKKKTWTIVGEIVSEVHENRNVVKSELTYLFHKGLVERRKTGVIKGRGYIWRCKQESLK